MVVAIATDVQDVYPPRVLVSVTGLTLGDDIAVYRQRGATRTLLRDGTADDVDDTSYVRVDTEQPFGVSINYVAVVNGTTEYASAPLTVTLTGGKVALSDGITGTAAEVVIVAWPAREWTPPGSAFRAGGRNYAVTGPLGQASGTVELFTETTSAADQLELLIRTATQGIVQVRQPGGYDRVDCYWRTMALREVRHSQDGTDQRRRWTLTILEVNAWAAGLAPTGFTLFDLSEAYDTLQEIADEYATLLDIAVADLSEV